LNFEFGSLGFVWDLVIGAWNFHDFNQADNFHKADKHLFEQKGDENHMGEIKSTLDLVMEKTRNLSLSDEEKRAQKQKKTEGRIKGLLQKYRDGLLTKNQLKIDYESLKKDCGLTGDAAMINEILSRLEPNGDNQLLLNLLEECCRVNSAAIKTTINDFRKEYHKSAGERMTRLTENLARNYAVSGSAVVPNLKADGEWGRIEEELHRRFEEKLNHVKNRL
jgi:hypothetical protein